MLGITEPAISQYLKNKRGRNNFSKKQKMKIKQVGYELIKNSNKKNFVKCMCKLCTCMEVGCK